MDERMTAREVADFLKVKRTTLYNLMREHGLPKPVNIGGSRQWLRDEIVAWWQARLEAR